MTNEKFISTSGTTLLMRYSMQKMWIQIIKLWNTNSQSTTRVTYHIYMHIPLSTLISLPHRDQVLMRGGGDRHHNPKALTRATGWWKDVESKIFVRDFILYHTHHRSLTKMENWPATWNTWESLVNTLTSLNKDTLCLGSILTIAVNFVPKKLKQGGMLTQYITVC